MTARGNGSRRADFDKLTYQSRLVAAAEEGLEDLNAGRALADDEVGKLLDERFGQPAKAKRKK